MGVEYELQEMQFCRASKQQGWKNFYQLENAPRLAVYSLNQCKAFCIIRRMAHVDHALVLSELIHPLEFN
jgi:hypothetical protein